MKHVLKFIQIFFAFGIVATMNSCEKQQIFTENLRVPTEMEFVQRTLPEGLIIGSQKPASLELVDLGLSVKWANLNVGAQNENEVGSLFSWGEIAPRQNDEFGWAHYDYNDPNGVRDPRSIEWDKPLFITKYCFDRYGEKQDFKKGEVVTLDKYDDAAYIYYGEGYRMPTKEEMQELLDLKISQSVFDKSNKCYHISIVGKNGNTITLTLPKDDDKNPQPLTSISEIWTSTLSDLESPFAYRAAINLTEGLTIEDNVNLGSLATIERCRGKIIRAVGN